MAASESEGRPRWLAMGRDPYSLDDIPGRTESQDSEAAFLELAQKHMFGLSAEHNAHVGGLRQLSFEAQPQEEAKQDDISCSPVALTVTKQPSVNNASVSMTPETAVDSRILQRHSFPQASDKHRRTGSALSFPELQKVNSSPARQLYNTHDDAAKQADAPQKSQSLNDDDVPRTAGSAPSKRLSMMEYYSQSPTQSNEGRSYDQYANDSSDHDGSQSPEHRTLHDNDTGAVKFDLSRPDPHLSAGDSFNDDLDRIDSQPTTDWHGKSELSHAPATSFRDQQDASRFEPETPAVPNRPFGFGPFGGDDTSAMIPPSQLFCQTQYTSAIKKASPTSSRPSPHIFNNNTISPNHPISSPLKDRGLRTSPASNGLVSSPPFTRPSSRLHEIRTSQDDQEENANCDVQMSPELDAGPARRRKLDPIEEYRSVHDFEILNSAQHQYSNKDGSDSDSDLADAARQRRARMKRQKAEQSLTSITFPRDRPTSHSRSSSAGEAKLAQEQAHGGEDENVEVPSTNRAKSKRQKDESELSPSARANQGCHESDSQETVADSQHGQEQLQAASGPAASEDQPSSPAPRPFQLPDTQLRPVTAVAALDTIPETSPACTAADYPKQFADIQKQFPPSNSTGGSLPPMPSTMASSTGNQLRREAEFSNVAATSSPVPVAVPRSSPTVIINPSQRIIPRSTRRQQLVIPEMSDPLRTSPTSAVSSDSSSLSVLSATPPRPSSKTSNTEVEAHSQTDASSPVVRRARRRGRPTSSAPKQDSSVYDFTGDSSSRASSRFSRASSDDILVSTQPSPAKAKAKITTARNLRQVPALQTSVRESNTGLTTKGNLFRGMTFAVTFQSKQRSEDEESYKDRVARNKSLKDAIIRQGGIVLSDGFDALFVPDLIHSRSNIGPAFMTRLVLENPDMGFTALIADEHSRKAKYIQALALGLPCLAPRWITTCLAKRKLVDWSSYLLCAGQSSFLGDAIRSRNLPYYDPTTSKLSEVIEQRPKLLHKIEVLVVLKRTTREDTVPYLFLVQMLGAMLTRVHSLDEARSLIFRRQQEENPFELVYIGDRLADVDKVLYGSVDEKPVPSRKRKRTTKSSKSTGTDDAQAIELGPPPKRVRALNDELVVQSLILGRLIEEDEMDL